MTPDIPNIRTKERNELVQNLSAHLEQDQRVRAAWLAGSIARGDDDWLSDIDIYVAVADESIEEVVQGRHEFGAQIVTPSLSMDQMRNHHRVVDICWCTTLESSARNTSIGSGSPNRWRVFQITADCCSTRSACR